MISKKVWNIKSKEGKSLKFIPHFKVGRGEEGQDEVLAERLEIYVDNERFTMHFEELMMFVYMVGNEEQRQKMANYYRRDIQYIPYNVTFKITPEEKEIGIAKRRIELPIDKAIIFFEREKMMGRKLKQKIIDRIK
jgi:hypothetical protein